MKKSLTLLLLAIASFGYAQVDIALTSIDKPEFIQDGGTNGTAFELQFTATNKGTALAAGDSIIFAWAILNEARTQIIVNANSEIFIVGSAVASGASFQSPTYNVSLNNQTLGATVPINMAVFAYVYNRSTSPVDADSTDNTLFKSYLWEKQYGASISSTSYNDDNLAVYPNPVSEELNVNLLFAQSNNVSIQLMDLTGKVVVDNSNIIGLSPNNYTMGVAGLENGLYILRVANGDKVSTTKVTVAH
jgi:hypothetical protein